MQFFDYKKYLNKETCDIVAVSTESLSIAEESEDDDFSQYPIWEREPLMDALDIVLNWDKYVELPDKWEIDEYSIMEKFCNYVEDDRISDALFSAIRENGAFRHFKDTLFRYGIEQDWYSFYEEALKKIAIDWCRYNEIISSAAAS